MVKKIKGILILLAFVLVLAYIISGCGQRRYEKALNTLMSTSFDEKLTAFEKMGDYGDAPAILDMLQKLNNGEYQAAADAYAAYTASGGEDIGVFEWSVNVERKADSVSDGELLKIARVCFRPLLQEEWDPVSGIYESVVYGPLESFHMDSSVSQMISPYDESASTFDPIAACGSAANGKVAIYLNDTRDDGLRRSGVCIGLMSLLPEQIYPASLAEVEYIIFVDYASENVGIYSDGSGALREYVHVTIKHYPNGALVSDVGTAYGGEPPETSFQTGSATSGSNPNYQQTSELIANALCTVAGGFADGFGYLPENGEATVLTWEGSGDVILPETLGGYPVTTLAAPAFCGDLWDTQNNWELTSVSLPSTLKTIGSYAFYCCEDLTSVILPDGLESIGEMAFNNCTALANIFIPSSVTHIGSNCFYGCADAFAIVCEEGSVAEQYAQENGYTVQRP